MKKTQIQNMRKISGEVNDNRKLVAFLYVLMRNHIACGLIEGIMLNNIADEESEYTNGWLAKYAQNIADRLS